MTCSQSVVIVTSVANQPLANAAIVEWWADHGADEFAARLSPTGQEPATHLACHAYFTPAQATALKDWPTGIVPTARHDGTPIDWSREGLTAEQAAQAGAALYVSVVSCADTSGSQPTTNIAAVEAALGLQRITGML
jgi:hypothetical protein